VTRSKRRARVNAFAKELDIGTPEGSRQVWAAPVSGRPPLLVARRERWVAIRMARELILIRPRRRRPFARDDIVTRLPYDHAEVRRVRWVGPLRQVVVEDTAAAPESDAAAYALEFALRDRRFAKGLVAAVESTPTTAGAR